MACWVVAILIVTSNIAESMVGRSYFWLRAAETRTLISLVQQYIEAPSVDPDGRVEPYPTPRQILAAVARYGSPLRDRLVPDPPPRPSVEVTERMLFRLIEPTLAIQVSTPPPSGTQGALVTTGSSASGLKAAGGTEVRFMAPYDGEVRAYLARSASFGREKSIAVQATALAWYALVIPDLGDGESWRIRFEAEDRSWTVVAAVMET